jgi:hypothetical protein
MLIIQADMSSMGSYLNSHFPPPGRINGPNDRLAALIDVNMLHSDPLLTDLPSQTGQSL